jgi:hypothetical protein
MYFQEYCKNSNYRVKYLRLYKAPSKKKKHQTTAIVILPNSLAAIAA